MGGAMFGDNLSFISDTTIAACNTQGCEMKDKFRTNFRIALPAALVTLALILVFSLRSDGAVEISEYHLLQTLPYLLVLIGGVAGVNVFLVLLTGIFSGAIIMLATGAVHPTELLGNMGSGASGMFETIMVTILVSAMCGLIREYGGFEALLGFIRRISSSQLAFSTGSHRQGRPAKQIGIGLLVGAMDIATAQMLLASPSSWPVLPIAKQMSEEYGITGKKSASLLDTFSCSGDLQIWSTVTGGAYHSGRKVTMCVRNDYKVGTHLNCIRSTHQPRPSTLFSPIFSLAREKIGPPEACWKRFAGLCFSMGMPDPEKTYFDRQTGHSQWPRPVFCIIPSGSRIHSLLSWGIYCDHTQCGSSRNSPGWRT